ncbi:MAG: aromatic ring-hydroxylating dioxygenase subunit alpha, partial [Planctomycetota bacterium]
MHPDVEAEILSAMGANPAAVPPPPAACADAPMGRAYDDAEILDRELARIFARRWIPIARESELPEPGAFVTLDVGSARVAAARADDDHLHAFHNVCLHRGAQVLREREGRTQAVRCPYHSLSYDLDGTLRGLPCAESFPSALQPGDARLRPIASAVRYGFLWIRLAGEGLGLERGLGPELVDELTHWPLERLEVRMRREVEAAFDWKVGVEAFLEPLHVPAIHGRTAHPVVDFTGMATRELGEHSRMALPFRSPRAFEPDGVLGAAAAAAGVEVFPDLNSAQRRSHLVYLLFPSTIWMLFPNHALTVDFLPAG